MLATPTRTECIFAALQGPVLRVSSSVVHMYHTYAAELLLPRSWRQSAALSASDVCAALLRLRVARPDAPAEALRCPLCGDVVSVRDPHSEPFGLPEGLESYCVSLRSRCSSPRRHLHAPSLVLALDIAPGLVACSAPFAVFAREPGSGIGACDNAGTLHAPDTSATEGASAGVSEDCCDCAVDASCGVTVDRPRLLATYVVVEVSKPRKPVRLPAMAIVIVDGMANVLRTLPGFMLQKSCIIGAELAVFVRSYQTKEEAERGVVICREYCKNNIPNVLNLDIYDAGVLISRCCNW
eukprot:m51a1_g13933 hypothetical protein (296) ;mRNA; r:861522-862682